MKSDFISVEEAERLSSCIFVDVRSPLEYGDSKIPNSKNIPILDDMERKVVGTIYRQDSPQQAKQAGIELVTPKIPAIVSEIKNLSKENQILLYCWRGGMRSQSVAQLCTEHKIPVKVLKGGYKSYRRHVNRYWEKPFVAQIAVLHGLSGVGKTKILDLLFSLHTKTINLEELAANRGSVFGNMKDREQPSQKDFEAALYEICKNYTKSDIVVTECEGRRIGNVHVPKPLCQAMANGIKIHLYASLDTRIKNIVQDYGLLGNDVLKQKISLLTKFLGKNKIVHLNSLIDKGDLESAAHVMLLDYYDPLYGYKPTKDVDYVLTVECNNLVEAAQEIIDFLQQYSKEVQK